jgi:carboxypeptidase C (cathepsin A)
MQGQALPEEAREQIIQKLARYTGLSPQFIDRSDLRIEIFRFTKELLRDEKKTIGRLDSRLTGLDRTPLGDQPEYDPSMTSIIGPYTAMFNQYVRSELKFASDLPYEILNPRVWPWSYAEHENRYVNVAETLRKAMTTNPFLKVFVANGYYDGATPFAGSEFNFSHLTYEKQVSERVSFGYYESGHMIYLRPSTHKQLKQDLASFIRGATGPAQTTQE